MSWQTAFQSYTTGLAFHIALSHDQASLVAHLGLTRSYAGWKSRTGRNSFVPTVGGLIKRGLVEHNPMVLTKLPHGVKVKWIYRLTPAGEHVFYLLKFSGLAELPQPAKAEQAA